MTGELARAFALDDTRAVLSDEGALILAEIDAFFSRFLVFPSDHAHVAVVLWVGHTHAVAGFDSTPRLALVSPEKGSGKTRTLEVTGLLVPEPLHAVNISAAALYRVVADRQPTLLLDEADTYLGLTVARQHEDIRALINAGHRRGATVYRGEVSGKAVRVVEFPAFAACALAGIGDLPDTILDRSVVIAMKRRAPHEHVEPFRERIVRPEADELRDRLAAWADVIRDRLTDTYPEMPDGITDRAADVWEPLIAIADAAGGDWPERARAAAVALTAAKAERDPSLGVQLLADCRRVFTERGVDRLPTDALVQALVDLDESPWGDLRGKPIDARGIAKRIRKYGIRPGDHRFDEGVHKGYRAEDFHDAWQRYLPVAPVAPVAHPSDGRGADGEVLEANQPTGERTREGENKPPLFTTEEAQQEQQAQHAEDPALDPVASLYRSADIVKQLGDTDFEAALRQTAFRLDAISTKLATPAGLFPVSSPAGELAAREARNAALPHRRDVGETLAGEVPLGTFPGTPFVEEASE